MTKPALVAFLHSRIHAVIATASKTGKPESALIGFGETENVELIIGTSTQSRKYQNLKANPQVALVMGWNEDMKTVQYEGLAQELTKAEWETYLPEYHAKVPGAAHFKDLPDQTYFLIKPVWIRYSDLSGEKEVIEEFRF